MVHSKKRIAWHLTCGMEIEPIDKNCDKACDENRIYSAMRELYKRGRG